MRLSVKRLTRKTNAFSKKYLSWPSPYSLTSDTVAEVG